MAHPQYYGHRCFHSCAERPGSCEQCVEFKRLVGEAAWKSDRSTRETMGQAIFDAMFPQTGSPPRNEVHR